MAGPITDAHRLSYSANVQLAIQQKKSKLEGAFTFHPDLKGRQAQMLELVGSTAIVTDLGRAADTPNIDNTIEPVWVVPRQLAWGKIIEKEDAIKALTDYQSPFVQAGAAAMVRGADIILSDAIFGARKIGQDGTTTSAWAGKTVAVGVGSTNDATATGMNVKKLIRARRYLQEDQVDLGMEDIFVATNAQGIEELFRDLTFISADYRDRKVLDHPENIPILGMTILPPLDGSAALDDYDADTFTAAVFAKSGVHYGDFSPTTTSVPLRGDKLMRPHPQMERWMGASRSEDKLVVKVLNDKVP